MPKLLLLRHLKSQWNKENRFTGWVDVPLTQEGLKKSKAIAKKVFSLKIDRIYTSPLFRNKSTVARLFEGVRKYPIFIHLDGGRMEKWAHYHDIGKDDIPVFVSEKLNERYYGRLQGLNKDEAKKRYGEKKVHLWRRGYDIAPPGGESLKEVMKRTTPFYKDFVEKDLKKGKNVLIVASHNSLRAIVKYLEKISDSDIINLEIPYAGLIEYQLDKNLKIKKKKEL